MRRNAACALALAIIIAGLSWSWASAEGPIQGVRVVPVKQFNELEARVTTLEGKVAELGAAPEPTPTEEPAPVEEPTETPTPAPEPTEEPTPTPDPETGAAPVPADFPTAADVGPDVEPTETYAGPCYIQQNNVVIEGKIVDCPANGLTVATNNHGLVIRDSVIRGGVFTEFSNGSYDGSVQDPHADDNDHPTVFTIEKSRVYSGRNSTNQRALGIAHYTVKDSLIEGFQSGAWAHNKVTLLRNVIRTDGTSTHQSGLRMLKNSVLRGNRITCTPVLPGTVDSGCSAHAVFYAEWGAPHNLTIEGNYFKRHADGGPWFGVRFAGCPSRTDCRNIRMAGNLFSLGEGTAADEFPTYGDSVWADNWATDGKPVSPSDFR